MLLPPYRCDLDITPRYGPCQGTIAPLDVDLDTRLWLCERHRDQWDTREQEDWLRRRRTFQETHDEDPEGWSALADQASADIDQEDGDAL